jgi:predicted SAM-dependent methyltransferase
MRQLLKKILMIRHFRRAAKNARRAYNRRFGSSNLKARLAAAPSKKIVIGASGWFDSGWIPTEMEVLNLLKPADWDRFFLPNSLDAILAEHVWEHLPPEEALAAARLCFKYLKPGGYLRLAVPDGLHPDPGYLELVKPQPSNGHKALYTHRSFANLFESSGFRVRLYEYFDEAGTFHYQEWDNKAGMIRRSKRFDPRNKGGKLNYTSIILDAIKP